MVWPICCRCSLQLRKSSKCLSVPNWPETRGKRSLHLPAEYLPPAPVWCLGGIWLSSYKLIPWWWLHPCLRINGFLKGQGGCRMGPQLEKTWGWIMNVHAIALVFCGKQLHLLLSWNLRRVLWDTEMQQKNHHTHWYKLPIAPKLVLRVMNVKRGKRECFRNWPRKWNYRGEKNSDRRTRSIQTSEDYVMH